MVNILRVNRSKHNSKSKMMNQIVFVAVCAIATTVVLGQNEMGYQMMDQAAMAGARMDGPGMPGAGMPGMTAMDEAQLGYPRRLSAGGIAGGFISHKGPFGHKTTKGGEFFFIT